uniref:(California timema) hypothetical protein n=1 Tax=Timema californicum TaxID=61474 RepID=A0A7R9IW52_TIMCA|nr:unnamed protein product [Timema californicum]
MSMRNSPARYYTLKIEKGHLGTGTGFDSRFQTNKSDGLITVACILKESERIFLGGTMARQLSPTFAKSDRCLSPSNGTYVLAATHPLSSLGQLRLTEARAKSEPRTPKENTVANLTWQTSGPGMFQLNLASSGISAYVPERCTLPLLCSMCLPSVSPFTENLSCHVTPPKGPLSRESHLIDAPYNGCRLSHPISAGEPSSCDRGWGWVAVVCAYTYRSSVSTPARTTRPVSQLPFEALHHELRPRQTVAEHSPYVFPDDWCHFDGWTRQELIVTLNDVATLPFYMVMGFPVSQPPYMLWAAIHHPKSLLKLVVWYSPPTCGDVGTHHGPEE